MQISLATDFNRHPSDIRLSELRRSKPDIGMSSPMVSNVAMISPTWSTCSRPGPDIDERLV